MKKSIVAKMFEVFVAGRWSSGMSYTREKGHAVFTEFWFLLISAGFGFEKTDLKSLGACCDEGHYSLAVRNGNLSFAYAYEYRHKRTPFIGTGLDYYDCHPSFSNHATQSKSAGRLVMGTSFTWQGEKVKVTSFNDKKSSLVACAYHERKRRDNYGSKIKKRFTITAEDFRKEMSDRKKLGKAEKALEEKGISVSNDHKGQGCCVIKKLKTKSKYYDTTGEVKPGLDMKKYKLFKSRADAIKFAETL